MTKADRIAEIVLRARYRVPRGFATISELEELKLGRQRLEGDKRYNFPNDVVVPLVGEMTSTYRYVGSGEDDPNHEPLHGPESPSCRYWIGSMLEIGMGGKVMFTMPFPAIGRKGDQYDDMCWEWVRNELESYSEFPISCFYLGMPQSPHPRPAQAAW